MLTYQNIIKEDHPDLRKVSSEVSLPLMQDDIDTLFLMNEYLENGYDDEKCTLYEIRPGVGLSAVQIGVLKRLFVVLGFDEEQELHHYAIINPKIVSHSEALTYIQTGEGCLSVDREVKGLVHRPQRITMRCHLFDFETRETKEVTLRVKGYMAIVFQHEYDHLFGRLFFDRINQENPFFVPENSQPVVFKEIEEETPEEEKTC